MQSTRLWNAILGNLVPALGNHGRVSLKIEDTIGGLVKRRVSGIRLDFLSGGAVILNSIHLTVHLQGGRITPQGQNASDRWGGGVHPVYGATLFLFANWKVGKGNVCVVFLV